MSDTRAAALAAATLYGEADPGNRHDAEAIARVIVNRAAWPSWWGDSIAAVCLTPMQFSCWNWLAKAADGRPLNRADRAAQNRLAPLFDGSPAEGQLVDVQDPWFNQCLDIARTAISQGGTREGINHYYASYAPTPSWARARTPAHVTAFRRTDNGCVRGHLFFAISPDGRTLETRTLWPRSKRTRGAAVLGGAAAAAGTDQATGGAVADALISVAVDRAESLGQSTDCGPMAVIGWTLFAATLGWMLWTRWRDSRGEDVPAPWMGRE